MCKRFVELCFLILAIGINEARNFVLLRNSVREVELFTKCF